MRRKTVNETRKDLVFLLFVALLVSQTIFVSYTLHRTSRGTMLWWMLFRSFALLQHFVGTLIQALICLCLFVSIAYLLGWVERYIWWNLEKQATKIFNDAKVTFGSIRLDWSQISQGKITLHASNVILHTLKRDEWLWESPLLGRVGKATVVCNAPIIIFHLVFFRQELPVEAYSIQASDIQVFVERHGNIFNLYLLDRAVVLPPPPIQEAVLLPEEENTSNETTPDLTGDESKDDSEHKEEAQQLVNDMIRAAQTLGRAARKGSLQGAIKKKGLELADKLQRLGKKENLEHTSKVVQEMGKIGVESLKTAKPILPERRSDKPPKPVYARIGRIVITDLRIFTKDSWIKMQQQEENESDGKSGWNKPIFIEEFIIRASELCPPSSLNDEHGLPAVYLSLDKTLEVIWKRLLAEMAKSNTGRLFHTAVGEVLSVMKTPSANSKSKQPTTPLPSAKSKPSTTPSLSKEVKV